MNARVRRTERRDEWGREVNRDGLHMEVPRHNVCQPDPGEQQDAIWGAAGVFWWSSYRPRNVEGVCRNWNCHACDSCQCGLRWISLWGHV
eukprot:1205552-Pyramimonas_sp.AAC.1